jgi:SAM-dependent methyltransferase
MTPDMTPGTGRPTGDTHSAEFDAFAADYSGGMDNSVKALLGTSSENFLAVKLRWLLRKFPALRNVDGHFSLLDYGCGRGDLLRLMAKYGLKPHMLGSDVSAGMLEEGIKIWPAAIAPLPVFMPQNNTDVPCGSGSIDLLIISSVLHHVAISERPLVYREINRLLKPGGHVVIFEHNPRNPVTRYVVSHTPIDQNAVLLDAREAAEGLRSAGLAEIGTSYIMFAPPRLRRIGAALDQLLGWLPMGAQYVATARKTL